MDPREKECRRFLAELGRGIPEDQRVMVCYKSEVTDFEDGQKKKGWPVAPYRFDKVIRSDTNAFVSISASKKTLNRKGQMHYWRGTASFGSGLAIMVDDIGDGIGSKGGFLLKDVIEILRPSAVIETSPGNYQVWYFLDKPEPDVRWFKAFLLAFVENVLEGAGGDPTIRDVSRLGRMPIGINNKRHQDGTTKYGGENGYENVHIEGMDDPPVRHSIEAIAAAFGFVVREPPPLKPKAAKGIDKQWFNIALRVLSEARMGEASGGRVFSTDGRYRIACPWAETHGTGNPYGAYIWSDDYKESEHPFVFGCAHHACKGRSWSTFVDHIVMPQVEAEILAASADNSWYSPVMIDDTLADQEGPDSEELTDEDET